MYVPLAALEWPKDFYERTLRYVCYLLDCSLIVFDLFSLFPTILDWDLGSYPVPIVFGHFSYFLHCFGLLQMGSFLQTICVPFHLHAFVLTNLPIVYPIDSPADQLTNRST